MKYALLYQGCNLDRLYAQQRKEQQFQQIDFFFFIALDVEWSHVITTHSATGYKWLPLLRRLFFVGEYKNWCEIWKSEKKKKEGISEIDD